MGWRLTSTVGAQQSFIVRAMGALLGVVALVWCAAEVAKARPGSYWSARHATVVGSLDAAVRLALLSDPHMAGPQYKLGSESTDLDNLSVIKTQQRLWETIQSIHEASPGPDLAVFMGDVVHNGLDYSTDWAVLTRGPVNGYHIAASLLAELRMPTLYSFGNHDYKVRCGDASQSADRSLSARLFSHFFGAKPYAAVYAGAWKVVALNSLLGHTWDVDDPHCNVRLSSYGPEQLAWLEVQLAEGKPTLVVLHFPLPTAAEEPDGSSIVGVLSAHSNVKLVLSGHFHKGFDWEDLYPFPHLTLPAVRYDSTNFFFLELNPDGTFRFVDLEKNRGGARCSDTWSYQGTPALVSSNSEGDCGLPLAADTDSYPLPEIRSAEDVPPGLNPEKSCAFNLASKFLAPCAAEGASKACCELLSMQFAPSSSWPFASCLCQPSFWRSTAAFFKQQGKEAGSVIDRCIASTGRPILRRGAGACPAASTPPSG